ncbi:MAG: hypothetical protein ACRDTE_08060 [Pseudonocardiaceae bacterium]
MLKTDQVLWERELAEHMSQHGVDLLDLPPATCRAAAADPGPHLADPAHAVDTRGDGEQHRRLVGRLVRHLARR